MPSITKVSESRFTQDQTTRDIIDGIVDDITALRAMTGWLFGSEVYDAANLVDAAGATTTGATITGAALGDFVLVSCSVDLQGITATAYVSAADTVKTRLQNESGGAIDLASATFRYIVIPKTTTTLAARNITKS